jgi:hypothetical protein
MSRSVWAERLGLAAAAVVTLGILGFYAGRLALPLPLFAGDEAAYLIRAIYSPAAVAADPFVAALNNGVHLSVIRAVYKTGAPVILGDRLVNAAAYLGGLALFWRACAARGPRAERIGLGLLALAFPFYRFAVSNLAEGLFVGVLVLLCLMTGRWYRSRPLVQALAGGAIAAVLVLVKPNGMAVVAALAILAGLDAGASGGWRRLAVRALLFAVSFFAVGNLIQWGAQEPAANPLAFFVSDLYGRDLAAATPPDAPALATLALVSMGSGLAILAGAPVVIGLADLAARRRAQGRAFVAEGTDLVFLLLVLSAAATVAMVALFAVKVAGTPGESGRLWGRYFEYFAPLLWLAAAPALARPIGPEIRWACAGVMLAGLAGLMWSFQAGIVLFPWDSSILTAFFHPDPVRAPLGFAGSWRLMAGAATGLAAAGLALRMRPVHAGLGLILALGVLSTWLDAVWLAPMVAQRVGLDRDIRAIRPALPPEPAAIALLAPDANDGHLGFFLLQARPQVWLGPPGGQAPPGALAAVQAVVVSGPETPPDGPWMRTFQGRELSLFRRPPGG